MSDPKNQKKAAIARGDEELLASLGYKQEFQRAFTGLEVFISLIIDDLITQFPCVL